MNQTQMILTHIMAPGRAEDGIDDDNAKYG